MPDFHVESLRYRLEADEAYGRFENPPPLERETDAYRLRLEDGVLTVTMKAHYATEAEARQRVEEDLRAWELDAALTRDHAWLNFVFDPAGTRIIDRDPSAEGGTTAGMHVTLQPAVCKATGTAGPPVFREYPPPPDRFAASTELEILVHRFSRAVYDNSQMLPFGYLIVTLLEGSAIGAAKGGKRKKAADQYRVDAKVLNTLSELTTIRGGAGEARKLDAEATRVPLTPDENAWVRAAIKLLIRRKAAYDRDPATAAPLPLLTMKDLPALPAKPGQT